MSVDIYCARTLAKAKLVVARLIGGEAYWRYLIQALQSAAAQYGFKLALLPAAAGEAEGLAKISTVKAEDWRILAAYMNEGGADNALHFLLYGRFLLGGGPKPPAPAALPPAALWRAPAGGFGGAEDAKGKPFTYIIFYRAYAMSGRTQAVEALAQALEQRGIKAAAVYVSGLKDAASKMLLARLFVANPPDIVLNATGFAASDKAGGGTILDQYGNIVLQIIFSAQSEAGWRADGRGLRARDVAMQVALPEMDGRILARAVSFQTADFYDAATECTIAGQQPQADRISFTADLAQNWLRLKRKPRHKRHIALIIANYPGGDGRLGHGVGLDTPQAVVQVLKAMRQAGYSIDAVPPNGNELIYDLAKGPTHEGARGRLIRAALPLADYARFFAELPQALQQAVLARWGAAAADAFCLHYQGALCFTLPVMYFGKIIVALQPDRAFGLDPKSIYHDPDIVPSHHYLAFYFWLRHVYRADAVAHMGKHGNLEWLPGKALALSVQCWPEAALGPLPHIYPFIVNDPGEGTQAKRRAAAVIIDHMTPPLTRAESYGPQRDLEALIDEYYTAAQMDSRRLPDLKRQIRDRLEASGLGADAGISAADNEEAALIKLDAFLCELKELQIRDGLHIFGQSPQGEQLSSLLSALLRCPPEDGRGGGSLQRAIAADLQLDFDPITEMPQNMAQPWEGAKPPLLAGIDSAPWRTRGDTIERIERLAQQQIERFLAGKNKTEAAPLLPQTQAALTRMGAELLPFIRSCGDDEMAAFLRALDGHFIPAGASGAPTRGRWNVFPMGRNFYALDNRAAPTETAWQLGRRSAEMLVARYVQDHGDWPTSFGLTAWGTANMRTGGDDIAQIMALIGVKPIWDGISRRVRGYEIIPPAKLGRPRVDVLLRVSGLFRDAFPEQLTLLGAAMRAVAALDESETDNPLAAKLRRDRQKLAQAGYKPEQAAAFAQYRIFGARPGHYGTGVPELLGSGAWESRADLGAAWAAFSAHAYGLAGDADYVAGSGAAAANMLAERLSEIEAVVQNQDNREHDILDSGEYYAFEGGMAAAAEAAQGRRPAIYHNDLSRPERPLIKTLEEELALTLRGRALNPKWLASARRHGYKGAAEMAAVVEYIFAFAATTGAVRNAHFDALYAAYLQDETQRNFLAEVNSAAMREIAAKLNEARRRNLWQPRSNSAAADLDNLAEGSAADGTE